MGIVNTQYIVGRHFDKDHPHLHLVYNRINNDGKTITGSNDRFRSEKICKELTEKYGLYFATGKENVKEHRLKEPDKTQYEIYNSLKTWVAECRNWEQLTTKLKEVGIEIEFKIKGNSDEVQGIRFKKNNYYFNGSKVDRMFSYSKINYQLSQNAKTNSIIQSHSMKSSTLSVGEHVRNSFGGLFNISSGSGTDKNETDFQHLMRKKKKKRKFGRQI